MYSSNRPLKRKRQRRSIAKIFLGWIACSVKVFQVLNDRLNGLFCRCLKVDRRAKLWTKPSIEIYELSSQNGLLWKYDYYMPFSLSLELKDPKRWKVASQITCVLFLSISVFRLGASKLDFWFDLIFLPFFFCRKETEGLWTDMTMSTSTKIVNPAHVCVVVVVVVVHYSLRCLLNSGILNNYTDNCEKARGSSLGLSDNWSVFSYRIMKMRISSVTDSIPCVKGNRRPNYS